MKLFNLGELDAAYKKFDEASQLVQVRVGLGVGLACVCMQEVQ